jgi:hypothetical protein
VAAQMSCNRKEKLRYQISNNKKIVKSRKKRLLNNNAQNGVAENKNKKGEKTS